MAKTKRRPPVAYERGWQVRGKHRESGEIIESAEYADPKDAVAFALTLDPLLYRDVKIIIYANPIKRATP
jgi:hypothetical protein